MEQKEQDKHECIRRSRKYLVEESSSNYGNVLILILEVGISAQHPLSGVARQQLGNVPKHSR